MNPKSILEIFRKNNYYIRTEEFKLNPIAIRSKNISDGFNDLFGVLYIENEDWKVEFFTACTDASIFFNNNPINKIGVDILIAGQYLNSMKIGHHLHEFELLRQIDKMNFGLSLDKEKIYNNKKVNIENKNPFANVVFSTEYFIKKHINKYTQGQIIIQNKEDFNRIKFLIKRSADLYNNVFDITLLSETQF